MQAAPNIDVDVPAGGMGELSFGALQPSADLRVDEPSADFSIQTPALSFNRPSANLETSGTDADGHDLSAVIEPPSFGISIAPQLSAGVSADIEGSTPQADIPEPRSSSSSSSSSDRSHSSHSDKSHSSEKRISIPLTLASAEATSGSNRISHIVITSLL